MDKQDFYNRLRLVINRPLNDLEVALLDNAFEKCNFTRRIPEFIDIADVQTRVDSGESFGHWLYDRKTKIWIINCGFGVHESLMKLLYSIYNNCCDDWCDDEFAEQYIIMHYGFFISASMNMYIPIKDDNLVFTPEEQVFDQPKIKGGLKWRGI